MVVVICVSNLDGVIVTLDQHGQLSCCYLGTDPAMFTVPSSEVREIDYKKLDQEMKHLQEIIRKDANKYCECQHNRWLGSCSSLPTVLV